MSKLRQLFKRDSAPSETPEEISGEEAVVSESRAEANGSKPTQKLSKTVPHPFWVLVQKEMSDHIRSWRYIILLALLALTCFGSLYTALSTIQESVARQENVSFVFLQLFTSTDGRLPNFIEFISFLGPLLGIALGFDAVNSERNKGTLIRVLSQPVPRDYVINAKFVSAILLIALLFFGLGFLVMAIGLMMIGVPPSPDEFLRMIVFLLFSVVYVAFWLNLAILFSVRFRQAATSALSSISIWLFFSVFYSMIMNFIIDGRLRMGMEPGSAEHIQWIQYLSRLSPSQLFNESTMTILMPQIASLGPISPEQEFLYIPTPLSIGQSLLVVWPQLTGLVAVTMICFAISYVTFMRQDIRART